jgi:hypothetical protein
MIDHSEDTKMKLGVCSVCQRSDIKLRKETWDYGKITVFVLNYHHNQNGDMCDGSYNLPQTTYEAGNLGELVQAKIEEELEYNEYSPEVTMKDIMGENSP